MKVQNLNRGSTVAEGALSRKLQLSPFSPWEGENVRAQDLSLEFLSL